MHSPFLKRVLRVAASLAVVAAITVLYHRIVPVNATTVALTFVLAILAVSTLWGMVVSISMSIAAALAFNYFFLPPVGTFSIADPQDWVAFFAFLVVSVLSSQLATRARQRAADATARRQENERLYKFSRRLLEAGNVVELVNRIPAQIVDLFAARAAALFLADEHQVYLAGPETPELGLETLKNMLASGEPDFRVRESVHRMPIRLGGHSIGSLGISGALLSRQSLEAIGTLIAVAVERARAVEQLGRLEASRQGEQLRTALLDAVTHALRTPLTSIKASVTNLLSNASLTPAQRNELLTIINEESDRLNELVGEATDMARLGAGQVVLQREMRPIEDVISAALDQCRSSLSGRIVDVRVTDRLPRVKVEVDRARQALVQLIENAHQYSPPRLPITIAANAERNFVVVSVADSGPGIDPQEQSLIFEKFYRGKARPYNIGGTGMGLPIAKAIIEAHGGTIRVASRPGRGSVFSIMLPAEPDGDQQP